MSLTCADSCPQTGWETGAIGSRAVLPLLRCEDPERILTERNCNGVSGSGMVRSEWSGVREGGGGSEGDYHQTSPARVWAGWGGMRWIEGGLVWDGVERGGLTWGEEGWDGVMG